MAERTKLDFSRYNVKLKKLFKAKIVLQVVGVISLLLLLFLPIIPFDGKSYNYFIILLEYVRSLYFTSSFAAAIGEKVTYNLTIAIVYGFPALFLLTYIKKLIKLIIDFIKTVRAINNKKVYAEINAEVTKIKAHVIQPKAAKNYTKRRKVNGVSGTLFRLLVLIICSMTLGNVWLNIFAEGGLNLDNFGFGFLFKLFGDSVAPTWLMVYCYLAWQLNLIFSIVVYVKKRATNYDVVDVVEVPESEYVEEKSVELKILSEDEKQYYTGEIVRIMELSDNEFVPPLSARRSTTQGNLKSGSRGSVMSYFEHMINQPILAALEGEKLLGFVSFIEDYQNDFIFEDSCPNIYLSTLIVDPAARGKGLTKKMYNHLFNTLYAGTKVFTRTWSTNTKHIKILSQFGFSELERIKNDRGEGVDTVYYEK